MRKLLFGILVTAGLQLLFQLYLVERLGRSSDTRSATAAIKSWPTDTIIFARGGDERTQARIPSPTTTRASLTRQHSAKRHIEKLRQHSSQPRPSMSSLIARNKTPRDDHPSEKKPRKSDLKALVSKALPVVKKPYDWIKALGSKLN